MSKHTVARQGASFNRFSAIPRAQIQRSVFNRSHDYKTTFDSGYLVPFYVDEVLPAIRLSSIALSFVVWPRRLCLLWTISTLRPFFSSFLIDSFGSIGRTSWVSRITLVTLLTI